MEASNQETVKCSASEYACTEVFNKENGTRRQTANEGRVNVCDVIEALQPLEHEYYKFGICAGLQPSELTVIKQNHPGSTFECLSTVVEKVINQKEFSWDEFANAVEKMGEFQQVEETLRQRAKSDGNQTERSKSGQTDPSYEADAVPDSSKMTFECGCGNCTIHDYIQHKACPKPTKEFPFLDVQGLSYEADMVKFSLHEQTRVIRKAFADFREDTFKSLSRNGCTAYRDVQRYVQRLVYPENQEYPCLRNKPHMEDCNSIKNASDYDQLEDALCDNYCSWFNYDILKELRCKFLIEDSERDEGLQKYEEKLFTYCSHRCFESPKRFHPEPLNEEMKTLVFKVEQNFHEFTLNQVRHITGTVRHVLNCPKYAVYVKSVQEGCVEVTCYMLKQFAEINSLSKDQVSTLANANIVSLKISNKELIPKNPDTNNEFIFHFKLPADGLALSSVAIVDGIPELRFRSSPKVPTITEQDVAAAIRLASEQKRPEFFYVSMPPGHPFSGRQFKHYSPTWLRGTSIGELLSEADWKMKCLHVGVQSNETKSMFWSWPNQSCLNGLATRFDFPQDQPPHSISMSCQSINVKKSANELAFPEEPKMKIVDDSNSLYSKYLTEIYQSVAYYDEPLFLKVQELIKLILSAEWLIEKRVRINRKWLMNYTMQIPLKEVDVESGYNSDEAEDPPSVMLPKQKANIRQPSNDVTAITRDHLINTDIDSQAVIRKLSVKTTLPHSTLIKKPTSATEFLTASVPQRTQTITTVASVGDYDMLYRNMDPNQPISSTILGNIIPNVQSWSELYQETVPQSYTWQSLYTGVPIRDPIPSVGISTHQIPVREEAMKPRRTVSQTETTWKGTYKRHGQELAVAGQAVYRVISSSEEFSRIASKFTSAWQKGVPPRVQQIFAVSNRCQEDKWTIPQPRIWQAPYVGIGEPSSWGGVTTNNFHVREEQLRPRMKEEREMQEKDNFRRYGPILGVRADHIVAQGSIRLLIQYSEEFIQVSRKFTGAWDLRKGTCPTVKFIFAVTNNTLKQKWQAYGRTVQVKHVEEFYHGTTLTCNIATTCTLCKQGNCGICGISSAGLDPQCISRDSFQRFGAGFYLAPNSSKCNDYVRGCNGRKAMLLCDVYPGRKYTIQRNRQHLTGPPPGYDSMYGNVGEDLNYPELVVYKPEAVMPRYIIVY